MTAVHAAWIFGTIIAFYAFMVRLPRVAKYHMVLSPVAKHIDLTRRNCAFEKMKDDESIKISIRYNRLDDLLISGWGMAQTFNLSSYTYAAILNAYSSGRDKCRWFGSTRNHQLTLQYGDRYIEFPLNKTPAGQ